MTQPEIKSPGDPLAGIPRLLGVAFGIAAFVAIGNGIFPMPESWYVGRDPPAKWWHLIGQPTVPLAGFWFFYLLAHVWYVGVFYFVGAMLGFAIKHPDQVTRDKLIVGRREFAFIFVFLLVPTYFLDLARSGVGFIPAFWMDPFFEISQIPPGFWFHLAILISIVALCFLRGRQINRAWLPVIPITALVAEFIPHISWIPLLPSALQFAALYLGIWRTAK